MLFTHFENKSQIKLPTRGFKTCMIDSRTLRAVVSPESLENAKFSRSGSAFQVSNHIEGVWKEDHAAGVCVSSERRTAESVCVCSTEVSRTLSLSITTSLVVPAGAASA